MSTGTSLRTSAMKACHLNVDQHPWRAEASPSPWGRGLGLRDEIRKPFERSVQLPEGLGAEHLGDVLFCIASVGVDGRFQPVPLCGEMHHPGTPVDEVGLTNDISARLKVTHEFIHRLLGDLELDRELRRSHPFETGMAEERNMSRVEVGVARIDDTGIDLVAHPLPHKAEHCADIPRVLK